MLCVNMEKGEQGYAGFRDLYQANEKKTISMIQKSHANQFMESVSNIIPLKC